MSLHKIAKSGFFNKFGFYYAWTTFISTTYLLVEAFRKIDSTRANGINFWDVVLTYGFLVFLATIENVPFSVLLAALEHISKGGIEKYSGYFLRLVILFCFILTWGYLIYWTLYRNLPGGIKTFLTGYGISLSLALTLILFLYFREKVIDWFDETTVKLAKLALIITPISLLLTIILLIEPIVSYSTSPRPTQFNGEQRPNVILIYVDALSANDMSIYGYPLKTTPKLDEIAEKWTVYTHAYTATTGSIANLPTVITGRYPYLQTYYKYGDMVQQGNGWLDLSRIMKDTGYETIWQGYNTPGYYHLGAGFDRSICEDGINSFMVHTRYQYLATPEKFHYPWLLNETGIPSEHAANDCNGFELNGIKQLIQSGEIGKEKPFFIYMHYPGVHGVPYPSGKYLGTLLPIEEGLTDEASQSKYYGEYAPADQPMVDKLRIRYDESILLADSNIAAVIQNLKDQNLYENTLIVVSADHGQNFYNSISSHTTPLMSDGEMHVPLLIKFPGQVEGQRIDAMVSSSVDLLPTILDSVGIDFPRNFIDGRSLLGSKINDSNRTIFSRKNSFDLNQKDFISGMQGKLKVVSREGRLSIFILQDDPQEKNSLVNGFLDTDSCYEARYKPSVQPEHYKIMDAFCRYLDRMVHIRSEGEILTAPKLK